MTEATAGVPPLLVLASASPARLRVLRQAGFDPKVVVSGVEEDGVTAATVAATAAELARLKCQAVAPAQPRGTLVLGCDSLLEFEGRAFGKPADARDARQRWRRMRGRSGVLHTGHALAVAPDPPEHVEVASTTVHFAALTDAEIDAYVATGEPLRVAGAFTVDGLGGPFVEGIAGDYHNVVGLSLPLLRHLLARVGVAVPLLWSENP